MRVVGIFLAVAAVLAVLGIVNLWRTKHPRRRKPGHW